MKRSKRRNVQNHSENIPTQNQNPGDCKWNGNTRISGEVEVKPDLKSQAENSTHNRKTRTLGWWTFSAIVLYTTVTALQWKSTFDAVKASQESNRLTEEATRGRIAIGVKLAPVQIGQPTQISITATNVGHSLAIVGYHFGYDRGVLLPNNDMPLSPNSLDTMLEPGTPEYTSITDPHLMTQEIMDHLPIMSDMDVAMNGIPHTETRYFYGQFDYESLGHKHKLEFCYFIVKTDKGMMNFDFPLRNENFVLRNCPHWNNSY